VFRSWCDASQRGVQVGVVDDGAGDAGTLPIDTPYWRFYRLIV